MKCSCEAGGAGAGRPCPFHSLETLLAERGKAGLGISGTMMITKRGEPIESKMMIAALRRTTKIAEVTEHSMRRAGALYYTRLGVELAVVQFLGRWGTDTVLQYVAEALAEKSESASIGGVGIREERGGSAQSSTFDEGPPLGEARQKLHNLGTMRRRAEEES